MTQEDNSPTPAPLAPRIDAALLPVAELTTVGVMRRMAMKYLLPWKGLVAIALLANLVVAASTGAVPWLLQQATDKIFVEKDQQLLLLIPAAAVIVMVIKAAATYVSSITTTSIGQRILSTIQIQLFSSLMRADLAWISSTHSGRFVSSFMTDAVRLRDTMTTGALINLTQHLVTVIALIVAMYVIHWQLALFATGIIPFAAFFMRRLGKRTRKATRQGLESTGDLSALVFEALGGIRVVKAYGQEAHEVKRASLAINQVLAHVMKSIRARAAASPLTEALSGIGIAAVLYYGGIQVQAGELTLGQITGFLSAMMLAYQPLKAVANQQALMQEGVAAAARVFPILDVEPKIVDHPDAKPLRVSRGAIRFDSVSFSYGNKVPVLNNVSIDIPAGTTVALVGPSGAGKTTILNLVPRFYDVTHGMVTIDGQDTRAVTLESLRQSISLVTQDPFLFDDTIKANICYGTPGATDDEIEQAARNAAAHEFISALPQGYLTPVGQLGSQLSGGQRQRIAIARAMLKGAPILLLDEATSALDTASEMQVQTALKALMKGRTTLVVAHRLSTVMHADNICVIDNGRVVEQGKHHELIARGGLYARLYQSQFTDDDAAVTVAGG